MCIWIYFFAGKSANNEWNLNSIELDYFCVQVHIQSSQNHYSLVVFFSLFFWKMNGQRQLKWKVVGLICCLPSLFFGLPCLPFKYIPLMFSIGYHCILYRIKWKWKKIEKCQLFFFVQVSFFFRFLSLHNQPNFRFLFFFLK